jgi:hypothetical protein
MANDPAVPQCQRIHLTMVDGFVVARIKGVGQSFWRTAVPTVRLLPLTQVKFTAFYSWVTKYLG